MYAIIVAGGKQYKVSEGDTIYIEKLDVADGSEVVFDNIVMIGSEEGATVGTPTVKGATVTGTAVKTGKQKKIMIFKYNAKKNYRRRQGHRQPYTKITIGAIKA